MFRQSVFPAFFLIFLVCAGFAHAQGSAPSLSGSFLSGYYALSQGDTDTAEQYLKEAVQTDPKNGELLGRLLLLQLTHGNMDDAFDTAHKLQSRGPHELVVDITLAVEQVKKGQMDAASELFNKNSVPQFTTIWLPLVQGWISGDTKVVASSTMFPKMKRVPPFLLYHLAAMNELRGHTKEAKALYAQAMQPLSQTPLRAFQAYASFLATQGDAKSIKELTQKLEQSRPDVLRVLLEQQAFIAAPDTADLTKQTHLISTPAQGVAEVLFTMASLLYAVDNTQDVLLYLRLVEYLAPEFVGAKLMLAHALEASQQVDEALATYSQFTPEMPLYTSASVKRAYLLSGKGRHDEALTLLSKVLEKSPNAREVSIAAGDVLRSQRKYPEAIKYYTDVIATIQTPTAEDWPVFFARGACFERLSEYKSAEEDLSKALRLAPKQPEVLNYLGYMWLTLGEHKTKAFQMVKQAYELAPHEPAIIDSYAWAHYLNGHYTKALELLEKAIDIDADEPLVNEHLGDTYYRLNRADEARTQWQRALDLSKDAEQQAALKTKIKQGMPTGAAAVEAAPEEGAEDKELVFE